MPEQGEGFCPDLLGDIADELAVRLQSSHPLLPFLPVGSLLATRYAEHPCADEEEPGRHVQCRPTVPDCHSAASSFSVATLHRVRRLLNIDTARRPYKRATRNRLKETIADLNEEAVYEGPLDHARATLPLSGVNASAILLEFVKNVREKDVDMFNSCMGDALSACKAKGEYPPWVHTGETDDEEEEEEQKDVIMIGGNEADREGEGEGEGEMDVEEKSVSDIEENGVGYNPWSGVLLPTGDERRRPVVPYRLMLPAVDEGDGNSYAALSQALGPSSHNPSSAHHKHTEAKAKDNLSVIAASPSAKDKIKEREREMAKALAEGEAPVTQDVCPEVLRERERVLTRAKQKENDPVFGSYDQVRLRVRELAKRNKQARSPLPPAISDADTDTHSVLQDILVRSMRAKDLQKYVRQLEKSNKKYKDKVAKLEAEVLRTAEQQKEHQTQFLEQIELANKATEECMDQLQVMGETVNNLAEQLEEEERGREAATQRAERSEAAYRTLQEEHTQMQRDHERERDVAADDLRTPNGMYNQFMQCVLQRGYGCAYGSLNLRLKYPGYERVSPVCMVVQVRTQREVNTEPATRSVTPFSATLVNSGASVQMATPGSPSGPRKGTVDNVVLTDNDVWEESKEEERVYV
ncbi:hypothetical protein KIPB_003252 [Kipferlia bialata]|uniref:Uncharacterized protein n=1 Tax=Kipferlia bialata TaxID=797122 RepID=A0A9K3GHA7_9EUKA|nr:hypothetical protein KIPB_003252 [Kipferlia bialata]|eukprot:g3252.t1